MVYFDLFSSQPARHCSIDQWINQPLDSFVFGAIKDVFMFLYFVLASLFQHYFIRTV